MAQGVIEMTQLERMLDGRMIEDLDERLAKALESVTSAQQAAEDLRNSNVDKVFEAITAILRDEVAELPALELKALHAMGKNQHPNMPLLNACIKANVPAYLHGESGSAKTFAAEAAATQHKLGFRGISLSPSLMDSRLLGYQDANGQYVRTAFRDIYENGGVFLFDEMDNANPSSLAVINNALANSAAEFADGRVEKHPNTRIVAAANTVGKGATALYVGRSQLDAATLDRFAFIPWDIDDDLETAIVTGKGDIVKIDIGKGGIPTPEQWLERVQAYREKLRSNGLRHVISMRASIYGKALAKAGVGVDWLDEMLIYKGMSQTDRDTLGHPALSRDN